MNDEPKEPENRQRHEAKRWGELGQAIVAFVNAGRSVNPDWLAEYNELTERVTGTTETARGDTFAKQAGKD
jgi:hypothetical protein